MSVITTTTVTTTKTTTPLIDHHHHEKIVIVGYPTSPTDATTSASSSVYISAAKASGYQSVDVEAGDSVVKKVYFKDTVEVVHISSSSASTENHFAQSLAVLIIGFVLWPLWIAEIAWLRSPDFRARIISRLALTLLAAVCIAAICVGVLEFINYFFGM